MRTYLQRLGGAVTFDAATYDEVESDSRATFQAWLTVALATAAAGVGAAGLGPHTLSAVSFAVIVVGFGWLAWALLILEIGRRIIAHAHARPRIGTVLRAIGFASAPGMARVLGLIPGAMVPVFAVTSLWMLAATVVAVQRAFGYESLTRAVAVCVLGLTLSLLMAVTLGLVLGPTLF